MSFKDTISTVAYMAKTLRFVAACVAWNLAGLTLSLQIGTPALFFDMTGTAIASLSKGLGYGVVVGLASNLAAGLLQHYVGLPGGGFAPDVYLWFGFSNAVGAVTWAVVPRIIVHRQRNRTPPSDFLSTNPAVGYRTVMLQIVGVGFLVASTVSVAAWFTQVVALECLAGPGLTKCADSSPPVKTAFFLSAFFQYNPAVFHIMQLVALFLINLPDKIIATSSAMMIIYCYYQIPNYGEQRKRLDEFHHRTRKYPKSFRIATITYWFFLIIFAITYIWLLIIRPGPAPGPLTVVGVSFLLLAVFAFRPQNLPLHNVFYRRDDASNCMYHDRLLVGQQSVHRDVFEDLLKTAVIVVMILNLIIGRVEQAAAPTTPIPTGEVTSGEGVAYLVGPILLLTLWRYFIVFVARFKGTLYRGPETRVASPDRTGPAGEGAEASASD